MCGLYNRIDPELTILFLKLSVPFISLCKHCWERLIECKICIDVSYAVIGKNKYPLHNETPLAISGEAP